MSENAVTGYKFIQKEVGAFLGGFGFKVHKASIFYRMTDNDLLQFLSFQKGVSSLTNQMTINIVQKGLFVPGCSFGTLQPGNRIGQFMNASKYDWWQCDNVNKAKEGAGEIKELISKGVLPFFEFSKDSKNIPELVTAGKYSLLWWIPTTFVDKGYFFLKAGLYNEAIRLWENHQPSKVPKFKTIRNLISQKQFTVVDKILVDNSNTARAKLRV